MQKSKRIPFTTQENAFIKESVKMIGCNWNVIAQGLPGRTPKQIHDRYFNYLRDGLIGHPWTKEEDEIINSLYDVYGSKWSKMMPFLPGRSGNDIKNRWHKHLSKSYFVKSSIWKNNCNYGLYPNFINQNIALCNQNEDTMMGSVPCFCYFFVPPSIVQMNNRQLLLKQINQHNKNKKDANLGSEIDINKINNSELIKSNCKTDMKNSSIFDKDFDFQEILDDIYSEFVPFQENK